jgi:hypothetical protein
LKSATSKQESTSIKHEWGHLHDRLISTGSTGHSLKKSQNPENSYGSMDQSQLRRRK